MQLVSNALRHTLPFALALSLAPLAAAQTTHFVDDDGPGDPFPGFSDPLNPAFSDPLEDGSAAHPFDDLWKAVDAALPGDEVVVLPSNVVGAYFFSDTLDIQGKAITLRSQAGPGITVLDGTSMPGGPGILMNSGEGAGTVVQAQLWYRDPQNTSNQTTSLSDAIEFTVAP